MSDERYRYTQGLELPWIQPEPGMSSLRVGEPAWHEGPLVERIYVDMEPGLHCGIPHFVVVFDDGSAKKYNAHQCLCAGFSA